VIAYEDADHEAVCASTGRHTVVVAPPGTGKTFLSVRIAGQIAPTLRPSERILLLTFSNQARAQLEREVRRQRIAAQHRGAIEIANYHGFFHREVWAYRRALGVPLTAHITSSKSRRAHFEAIDRAATKAADCHKGLLDAFAEQKFERFRDERTPTAEVLERLLAVVQREQQAGRLLFDDLGALFWDLLERYPTLSKAYSARYPVVIADEHQDASELQDSAVRRLFTRRLIVFADPLQLIYGFRGSKPERLERHLRDCNEKFELRTPHRWRGDPVAGKWLLAVRDRLCGINTQAPQPATLRVIPCQYRNKMKSLAKYEAIRARRTSAENVAIITATNNDLYDLMRYLSRENLFPRQLGGDEFDRGHEEMQQLPLLNDMQSLVHHAADRIAELVPAVSDAAITTVKKRAEARGMRLGGRLPEETKSILTALSAIYANGPGYYFGAVVSALNSLSSAGHNLPRLEAVRALRATADALSGGVTDLDDAISAYRASLAIASQTSHQIGRGIYVLTAHQAKGKEFGAVVLFDVSQRHYADEDERRRLFYVAVTRATMIWTVLYPQDSPSPLLRFL
jgi:ATP-dependent exoDNAse (exonuclease V) beta subunit